MPYRLPKGYKPNPRPVYFEDATEDVWQPRLYQEVAADPRCANTILDLGCGNGEKLVALPGRFRVIGVDKGPNIQRAVRQARGEWVALDLERAFPSIPAPARVTIICADVVEHLRDPRRLLYGLSRAHRLGSPLIVVSTPDRDKTRGEDNLGPPGNPCHAREWTPAEFQRLLEDYGLFAEPVRWTLTSTRDERRDTMVFTVAQ